MTYQQEHEEDFQSINEDTYDELYNKCETALNTIKYSLDQSSNPWLLMNCEASDLMGLIETGVYELPEYFWNSGRVNGKELDNIFVADPIEYVEEEEEDLSGWMTVTANGLVPTYQTENEKEEELKKEEEKLEAIRAQDEKNKHNWTMTREERGLPKTQPKQVKVVKKSKSSKRRNRRFKINKSTPIRPKTIEQKPKSKYQPQRVAHKYE